MLAALRWELHVLKSEADLPELLPVWQIAFALEGLLKQLTDKLGNVTASALRTVAGGVDLLDDLCRSLFVTARFCRVIADDAVCVPAGAQHHKNRISTGDNNA